MPLKLLVFTIYFLNIPISLPSAEMIDQSISTKITHTSFIFHVLVSAKAHFSVNEINLLTLRLSSFLSLRFHIIPFFRELMSALGAEKFQQAYELLDSGDDEDLLVSFKSMFKLLQQFLMYPKLCK